MPTILFRLRQHIIRPRQHDRPEWWAYLGSFGDDILFDDAHQD